MDVIGKLNKVETALNLAQIRQVVGYSVHSSSPATNKQMINKKKKTHSLTTRAKKETAHTHTNIKGGTLKVNK